MGTSYIDVLHISYLLLLFTGFFCAHLRLGQVPKNIFFGSGIYTVLALLEQSFS